MPERPRRLRHFRRRLHRLHYKGVFRRDFFYKPLGQLPRFQRWADRLQGYCFLPLRELTANTRKRPRRPLNTEVPDVPNWQRTGRSPLYVLRVEGMPR